MPDNSALKLCASLRAGGPAETTPRLAVPAQKPWNEDAAGKWRGVGATCARRLTLANRDCTAAYVPQ